MQRKIIGVLLMALIIGLAAATPQTAEAEPEQQNPNLLANPGFEPPYYEDFRADGGGFVANGWRAWWYNDSGDDYDAPEFKEARLDVDPFRVRNGLAAQQYFRPWAKHLAGFSQLVNVTPGSRLRFSIYGHAWSSFCEFNEKKDEIECDARNSFYGGENKINMKIGIAPVGTLDQNDPAIVWSETRSVYDNFELFTVEATAVGDTVTVFTYSTPDWPSAVINVYWDDAELIVVGDAPPPADEATDEPPPPPPADNNNDSGGDDSGGSDDGGGTGSVDTSTVNVEGAQVHIVQSGETLGGIAFAYGIPTQRLRELNGLTTDTVFPGQQLIVAEAPPPTPTPTPTPEPTEEPTEEATVEVAEVESEPVGRICASLFEDHNANGTRDGGEALLPGGLLSVTGPSAASHPTDGVSEPFCFEALDEGSYTAAADAPNGYTVTGQAEMPVQVVAGQDVMVSFGAAPETAPVELQPDIEAEVEPDAPADRGSLPLIIGIVGGLLLLIGIGVAVYLLVIAPRRASV